MALCVEFRRYERWCLPAWAVADKGGWTTALPNCLFRLIEMSAAQNTCGAFKSTNASKRLEAQSENNPDKGHQLTLIIQSSPKTSWITCFFAVKMFMGQLKHQWIRKKNNQKTWSVSWAFRSMWRDHMTLWGIGSAMQWASATLQSQQTFVYVVLLRLFPWEIEVTVELEHLFSFYYIWLICEEVIFIILSDPTWPLSALCNLLIP